MLTDQPHGQQESPMRSEGMLPESDDHVESEHCLKNRLKILVDSETHWNLKGVHLENDEVFVGSW